jgi:hypothetical protein
VRIDSVSSRHRLRELTAVHGQEIFAARHALDGSVSRSESRAGILVPT